MAEIQPPAPRRRGLDARKLEERTGRQIDDVDQAIREMYKDLSLIREHLTEDEKDGGLSGE